MMRVLVMPNSDSARSTLSSPTCPRTRSAAALSDTVIIDIARSRQLSTTGSRNVDTPVGPGVQSAGLIRTVAVGDNSPDSKARHRATSSGSL